jgi:GTP-binding protein YchF
MKLGIVGLPNVGKSTLFNAITKAGAAVANYPFCTIEPNVGIVPVPDARLAFLADLYHPKKTTSAVVEFVDIAGLVAGASKGEGLGNKFLSHIRECEAIVHMVRCFEDKEITHVTGSTDPLRDIQIIETELSLADLESLDKRLLKAEKGARSGDKAAQAEKALADRLKAHLDAGKPARTLECSAAERELLKDFWLLTAKPVLYACNVAETDLPGMANAHTRSVEAHAKSEGAQAIPVCAKLEAEVAELAPGEQEAFLKELGLSETGLNRLIRAGYRLLGLQSFYTAGEDECRAWTIRQGTAAPEAAGAIHSDIEKGFIRAEIMSFDDLKAKGSDKAVKESGMLRVEGRDYVMKDGDVVYFRFNV